MHFDYYDVSCIDQEETTALILAAEKGYHECLLILLTHGAQVDMGNNVSVMCAFPCDRIGCLCYGYQWALFWTDVNNYHFLCRMTGQLS